MIAATRYRLMTRAGDNPRCESLGEPQAVGIGFPQWTEGAQVHTQAIDASCAHIARNRGCRVAAPREQRAGEDDSHAYQAVAQKFAASAASRPVYVRLAEHTGWIPRRGQSKQTA